MTKKLKFLLDLNLGIRQEIEENEVIDWKSGGRIHNWKNYVDSDLQNQWGELTLREKFIIATMADTAASREEWD